MTAFQTSLKDSALVFFMFFFVIALLKTQRQTGIFITKQKGSYANTFTGTRMH